MLEVVWEANARRTKMSHASMSHEKRKGVKKMKKEKKTRPNPRAKTTPPKQLIEVRKSRKNPSDGSMRKKSGDERKDRITEKRARQT